MDLQRIVGGGPSDARAEQLGHARFQRLNGRGERDPEVPLTVCAELRPASHHDALARKVARHLPAGDPVLESRKEIESPLARRRR
mgnify:CR=1 FL=1